MKRLLLLFIIFVILLIVAKTAYTQYCISNPIECEKKNPNYEEDGLPQEGVDW